MSPAKQKSKDRQAARDQKASGRQTTSSNGTGASAYNPLSGTFHTLESVSTDAGAGYLNGRFKTIDDDDNTSSNGGTTELECMSNNGSCSGESEDLKEKHTTGKSGNQGGMLGDKGEKIRGKNERKHQRQKEKRAQELRDKCTGYLMSRKLEALSQQLVAMGFSQERATMALIFNDGHVEQSVAWLLEGGENQVQEDWNAGSNPKIDISEELGRIIEIEKKYKLPRADIERVIVSCEGDLEKALKCLPRHSRSSSPTCDKGDPHKNSAKDSPVVLKPLEQHTPAPAALHVQGVNQPKNNVVLQQTYQIRRDERVSPQSTKGKAQPNSVISYTSLEGLPKKSSPMQKLSNPLIDCQGSMLPLERKTYDRDGARFSSLPTKVSPPYASHFPPIPKTDTGLIFGDPKLTVLPDRESVMGTATKDSVQTRPHVQTMTLSSNNYDATSSPPFSPSTWAHNLADVGSPPSVLYVNATHDDVSSHAMTNIEKKAMDSLGSGMADTKSHYNSVRLRQPDPSAFQWGNWIGNGLLNENAARQSWSLSATTYGLFTGWGAHSSVDWSTGPKPNLDYRSIDWSMNASSTSPIRHLSSSMNLFTLQEREGYFWNNSEERGIQREGNFLSESYDRTGVRQVGPTSLQENASNNSGNTGHEWTSPFAGKDLFNLPQAIPSPLL